MIARPNISRFGTSPQERLSALELLLSPSARSVAGLNVKGLHIFIGTSGHQVRFGQQRVLLFRG